MLQQQRPHVETRIKGLVNDNLKEICRAYNVAVSGTKAVLQNRCIQGKRAKSALGYGDNGV